MILDAHVHCWDVARFPLEWARGHPRLDRTHEAEAYRHEADACGISGCILVEVDVAPRQRREEADDQVARCASGRGGALAAVPCLDPRQEGFLAAARELAREQAVRALRWIARSEAAAEELAQSPIVERHLQELEKLDLAFDLNVPVSRLPLLAGLAARCPGTRFILDHLGYADPEAFAACPRRTPSHDATTWCRAIDSLAAQPNVACKISGLANRVPEGGMNTEAIAPIVTHARSAFGAARLLFGSDWPVIGAPGTLASWVEALRALTLGWPPAERQQLFGEAARHWYALPAARHEVLSRASAATSMVIA